jgi:hypothetical protein
VGLLLGALLCRCAAPVKAERAAVSLALACRIAGTARNGELGFRFGPPKDVDGDGIADIAAGARGADLEFTQMGIVSAWSSDGGREIVSWEGHAQDGLFGHAVIAGPDADGDGVADVVAAAPNGKYHEVYRGVLFARSGVSRRLLWSVVGSPDEPLGWHLALAGDQNRDGVIDVLASAPAASASGKVYLISGRDGAALRSFASAESGDQFGWYHAAVPDLDGDGRDDLVVGAPLAALAGGAPGGAAYAFSSADGRVLHAWRGTVADARFGEVVAGLPDLDGDGIGDAAASAPFRASLPDEERPPGEVVVFSGASGRVIHRWRGAQPGELYGRMVSCAGDVNADGAADVAIGAPWSRAGGIKRAGRFELRCGRSGGVLGSVEGDRPEMWLGWHIEAAEKLGRENAPGLVVSALRSEENGIPGAGALHVYVLRPARR